MQKEKNTPPKLKQKSALFAGLLAAAISLPRLADAATIVIFDDAFQNGFTSVWNNSIVGSSVITPHSGDFSLRRDQGTGNAGPYFGAPANMTLNSLNGMTTLEFWANSIEQDSTLSRLDVRINATTTYEMGTRGDGVTWVVDGVPMTGNVRLNNDPDVWQHVTFDLTQTFWVWDNGDSPRTLDPNDTITWFEIRGETSGTFPAPYVDSVQLIPEPGTLALVLLSGLSMMLVFRRKRG